VAIEHINDDAVVKAAVLIGAGRTFVSGADIKEFDKMRSGEASGTMSFPDLLMRIENCKKPVVMAIHGNALGGGLELAMAGHYRVAVPGAQVGQPEVKLGIIPGAHGTQRLPRLAGVAKALAMCVEGKPILAPEALNFEIVDRLIEGDLLSGAISFAREIAAKPIPKTRDRTEKLGTPEENAAIFAAARETVRKKQRGMMAPLAAIDAVEAATKLPFDEGCQLERKLFMDCLLSDQSKALIHVFFGEREVAKIPDVPKDTPTIPVNRAAVVGAGTMGGGIAMVFANAGIPVFLKEADQAALDRGMANIRKNYAGSVARGRFTQQFVDERLKLIQPAISYDGFADADMVIEAVFEGMGLKKQVFTELDRVCKPDAILASNTSTLNIDEIAAATSRPEFVIGTHFFSPANVMRLLEIVRGKQTSKQVIATAMQLSKKLGKIGVLVGNCRGFVGNRMFHRSPLVISRASTWAGASERNIVTSKSPEFARRSRAIAFAKWDASAKKLARAGTSMTSSATRRRIRKSSNSCASGVPRRKSRSEKFPLTRSLIAASTRLSTKAPASWKRDSLCVRLTSTSSTSMATVFPLIAVVQCGTPTPSG
jgi:3-hydroxyacyl-CoA dehydrogenase